MICKGLREWKLIMLPGETRKTKKKRNCSSYYNIPSCFCIRDLMYPTVSLALTVISNSEPVKVSIIMSYCILHIWKKIVNTNLSNALALECVQILPF